MFFLTVKHEIDDFDTWKAAFDESEDLRNRYHLGPGWILRDPRQPNMITVALQVEDLGLAREFIHCKELRDFMDRGGVIGRPDVNYLQEVARVNEPVAKHRHSVTRRRQIDEQGGS